MNDTIAAIASPLGEGALAVLRVSGSKAVEVGGRVLRTARPWESIPPRRATLATAVFQDAAVDEVLFVKFAGPASFTGEDLIEITCHGGVLVTRRILDALLANGARMAEPGEFTQRAFLNGKMDLTQAEAVMDLIRAQSDQALKAAKEQLQGRLGRRVENIGDQILDILAHVEAYIDFPDEDIDPATGSALAARIGQIEAELNQLLQTADEGRLLREGIRTVIAGPPNAGKSSLLNLLLGFERAIVSHIAGTTRDTIEEAVHIGGLAFRLVDTAGLRHSEDPIEQAGIGRTHVELEKADLVLRVFDGTLPCPQETWGPRDLLICNKADLPIDPSWEKVAHCPLSCVTSLGRQALGSAMVEKALSGIPTGGDPGIAINARHQACLRKAHAFIQAAREGLEQKIPVDLLAEEVRAALNAVGEVIGKFDTDQLLDRVFSTFCLGK